VERDEYDRLYSLEDAHWRFRALRGLLDQALDRWLRCPVDRPPRFLDAGCGTGGTAASLARRGSVTGVDLNPHALELAVRRGLPDLVRGSVERLPFADASFDAVIAVDVLYHRGVGDDADALAELSRVCRPGGIILLWLAAYEWMRGAHDVVVHTERRYTRRRTLALAARAGLAVEHATYVNALLLPPAAVWRWFHRTESGSDVEAAPGFVNDWAACLLALEGRVALRTPLPFGLSIFAVLRRPESPPAP